MVAEKCSTQHHGQGIPGEIYQKQGESCGGRPGGRTEYVSSYCRRGGRKLFSRRKRKSAAEGTRIAEDNARHQHKKSDQERNRPKKMKMKVRLRVRGE